MVKEKKTFLLTESEETCYQAGYRAGKLANSAIWRLMIILILMICALYLVYH